MKEDVKGKDFFKVDYQLKAPEGSKRALLPWQLKKRLYCSLISEQDSP